jgi:hypothetical protein
MEKVELRDALKIFNKRRYLLLFVFHYGIVFKNLSPFLVLYRRYFVRTRRHSLHITPIVYLFKTYLQFTEILKGFCMHVVGTIDRHGRSRTLSKTHGSLRVSSVSADIDFYAFQAITVFGCLGFKF